MTITHTTPTDVIQAQCIHLDEQRATIERLRAELQQERAKNATLTAKLLSLPTTDLTPAEVAQALIDGCPQWRAVALRLINHAMEESA